MLQVVAATDCVNGYPWSGNAKANDAVPNNDPVIPLPDTNKLPVITAEPLNGNPVPDNEYDAVKAYEALTAFCACEAEIANELVSGTFAAYDAVKAYDAVVA